VKKMDPGSAAHRFALRSVRGTSFGAYASLRAGSPLNQASMPSTIWL